MTFKFQKHMLSPSVHYTPFQKIFFYVRTFSLHEINHNFKNILRTKVFFVFLFIFVGSIIEGKLNLKL